MYGEFCQYIRREGLFKDRHRFLIALSGGVDSVVLTDLVWRYKELHPDEGLHLALVHCNFHLRGGESDRDENFVRKFAESYPGVPLFVESFDTSAYAAEHKVSIEMAAREQRYGLFERLMRTEGYDACLLAHHADDNAETFFINLFRGSGVKGLRGMKPLTRLAATAGAEKFVWLRPLLWARRAQIEEYARIRVLPYVEDSSNAEQIYLRNKIRHRVLPLMEQVSEGFTEKVNRSMDSLRRVDALLDDWYAETENRVVGRENGTSVCETIPVGALASLGPHVELFLELYLRKRAFSRAQIGQVLENYRHGISGKCFENIDSSAVFVREQGLWRYMGAGWRRDSTALAPPSHKRYDIFVTDKAEINPSPNIAYLNYEKLQFPLTWRHPGPGDRFKPLGARGFKKLSDFFKDEKVGVGEREAVWLLCSGEDIVWVVGYRMDDRYKLHLDGDRLRHALVVEIQAHDS